MAFRSTALVLLASLVVAGCGTSGPEPASFAKPTSNRPAAMGWVEDSSLKGWTLGDSGVGLPQQIAGLALTGKRDLSQRDSHGMATFGVPGSGGWISVFLYKAPAQDVSLTVLSSMTTAFLVSSSGTPRISSTPVPLNGTSAQPIALRQIWDRGDGRHDGLIALRAAPWMIKIRVTADSKAEVERLIDSALAGLVWRPGRTPDPLPQQVVLKACAPRPDLRDAPPATDDLAATIVLTAAITLQSELLLWPPPSPGSVCVEPLGTSGGQPVVILRRDAGSASDVGGWIVLLGDSGALIEIAKGMGPRLQVDGTPVPHVARLLTDDQGSVLRVYQTQRSLRQVLELVDAIVPRPTL